MILKIDTMADFATCICKISKNIILHFYLQKYKEFFERCLAEIEAERQRLMVAEQRWTDSWHTSVKKVKLLYEAWPPQCTTRIVFIS